MARNHDRERGATRMGDDAPRVVERDVLDVRPGVHEDAPGGSERPGYQQPVREQRATRQATPTEPTSVDIGVAGHRADQVRWGPVWAGLIVALPTFLLLELACFALGWLDLGQGGNQAGWVSGVIGLFSFFLGGLTAGATAMWRGMNTGLLHGILVWALGVVAFLFLTLFGGGALLGTFGNIAAQVVNLSQVANNVNAPNVPAQQAVDTARSAASWGVLGLGLSIAASALGGVIGAKTWPRKRDTQPTAAQQH